MLNLQKNIRFIQTGMFNLKNVPLGIKVEKTIDGVEKHWLSGKKIISAPYGQERSRCWQSSETWNDPSLLIFLQKGLTVNNDSYCKFLRQKFILFIELIF